MEQSHDRSYHRLFSEPALVEDLLRHFVEESWVADLDFSHMERLNTKFHADSLERRESDIIVRIPFLSSKAEVYLLLLLEFQSTDDPWMALRFGTYVHLLYEQLIKEKRLTENGKLPPVFPLLLYNGDTPWRAATELKPLIALPPHTPLWRYQPNLSYHLLDESRYPEGKPGTLSGLIFRLENAKSAQEFKHVLGDMVNAVPTHLGSLRRALAVWIAYVLAPHRGIELQERDIDDLDEVKNMLATRIEQWKNDLLKEGLEKGIERGEAAMLTKMLILKYGPLPAQIQAQIDQADTTTLEHWAERMLGADALEEVFEFKVGRVTE